MDGGQNSAYRYKKTKHHGFNRGVLSFPLNTYHFLLYTVAMRVQKIDRPFFVIVIILMLVGFLIFSSASLGLLTRDGINISSAIFGQIFLGLFWGSVLMFFTSRIDYKNYKKYSFYIFLASLILTSLVFSPLGFEHGGAKRWLDLGIFSFQPAEFLKLGFVIYLAAWLSSAKKRIHSFKFSILPTVAMLVFTGAILIIQPDMGTFLVIFISAVSMLLVSGVKWKHIFVTILGALGFASVLVLFKPYIWQRILTFLQPSADVLNSGYQIKQSLLAVGSGQIFGRGFGKSIQKFYSLPEPIGDSIFAVTAEEWGFVGCVFLIALFLFFAYRGFHIASKTTDNFGGLLAVGIVILIVSQSFINMASMIGIFPLTGMPLLFVSHGGTALMFTLLEVGIVFNISKHM